MSVIFFLQSCDNETHLIDSAVEGAHDEAFRVHVEDEILTHHSQPN